MIIDNITHYDAIFSLAKGHGFSSTQEGKVIEWHSPEIPQPTDAEIQAELTKLQEVYDSQEYARIRRSEYDKLNQFEMRYDDLKNGTSTWEDAIDAIKLQFPKGGV